MVLENGTIIEDTGQYRFIRSADCRRLLFEWRHVAGRSPRDFRKGIAAFANQCRVDKPATAVIDAAKLDQTSPAVAWLRGQTMDTDEEDYIAW